jgi:hypothetical protein
MTPSVEGIIKKNYFIFKSIPLCGKGTPAPTISLGGGSGSRAGLTPAIEINLYLN